MSDDSAATFGLGAMAAAVFILIMAMCFDCGREYERTHPQIEAKP